MHSKRELGLYGEQLACEFLLNHGYRILERNWRCRLGEMDIIAMIDDQIVFVEVKTRSSTRFGQAVEAVDQNKQTKLKRLAEWYMRMRAFNNTLLRFDVICVQFVRATGTAEIQHYPYAF